MPILTINTNLSKEKIPADFLQTTAKLVATTLQKPVSYIVIHINPEQMMSWGETSDPCAAARLESIGRLGKEENKKHAACLYSHLEKTLGIKKDRMYISFVDLDKADVGYKGTTFDDLM